MELQQADILLHYLCAVNDNISSVARKSSIRYSWFPITSISEVYGSLPLMSKVIKRASSKK
ncbi:MAG: hypothetical protein JWN56_868 [Sphingobacteriales bacterium]|nr:hypothetical protein [Sphingobacteriales bacterium]